MRRYTVTVNDKTRVLDVEAVTANSFQVHMDGRLIDVTLDDHRDLAHSAITPSIQVRQGGATAAAPLAAPLAAPAPATASPSSATPAPRPAAPAAPAPSGGAAGLNKMTAPMPGVILEITAGAGAQVKRGETLMVLEAMKMKNALKAPKDGTVAEVYVTPGQQVKYGETLVRFEES